MKSLVPFTTAILAWVSYEASATETSCTTRSRGSIFLPHQHHTLIGHSFLNQSGTVRIKCMMLCWRNSRCLSFNHNVIKSICQLNDASKEDFPDSYKQDGGFSYFGGSSNKAAPLPEETKMTTKTEQETSQAQTTTKLVSTAPAELSTETLETTSAKSVDTEGPEVIICPQGVFGLSNDSNARTSVQWQPLSTSEDGKGVQSRYEITCIDDDEGRTVVSGDFFKVGTTTVTCKASDDAGNPGDCTFPVTITVCNMTRLGMESGAIADDQITALYVLNNDDANYGPTLARLNSIGSWCGEAWLDTWIQVDLIDVVNIYGLIIQDRYDSNEQVMFFKLSYFEWPQYTYMMDADNTPKIYIAEMMPGSQYVVVSVQTTMQEMIRTRIIRIEPLQLQRDPEWLACMRFELISCN